MNQPFKPTLLPPQNRHPWLTLIGRSRFFWLLVSLVIMILFSSEIPATTVGRAENGAGCMIVLLRTTIAARGGRKRYWLMFALNALTLAVWFLSLVRPTVAIHLFCFLLFVISLFCAVCFTLAYVLRAGVITLDHILGAICAYILIAMISSTFFMFAWVIDPNAFKGVDPNSPRPWADLFYFSSTTLSTVGYGDIAPGTYRARSLTIIEQFLGTFYIAILISRLTGLYTVGTPAAGASAHVRTEPEDIERTK